MMGYGMPDYTGEPWYPLFIISFVLCLMMTFAGVVIDAIKAGYRPRDGGLFVAALGLLMMATPPGIAFYFSVNLTFIPEMPWRIGLFQAMLCVSSFIWAWSALLSPHTVARPAA